MKLKKGMLVWIPCEVKPGPFSNERLVRVIMLGSPRLGFVDVRFLQDQVSVGPTRIKGQIATIQGDQITVSLPGHPVNSSRVRSIERDQAARVPLVPVPA